MSMYGTAVDMVRQELIRNEYFVQWKVSFCFDQWYWIFIYILPIYTNLRAKLRFERVNIEILNEMQIRINMWHDWVFHFLS